MLSRHTSPTTSIAPNDWFQSLVQPPSLGFGLPAETIPNVRLIRLDEINEEHHQAYRQALANVYATLDPAQRVRLLYVLDGGPNGVALYFGVVADHDTTDLHEAIKNLRSALEGQLPGINFAEEVDNHAQKMLLQRWGQSTHQGVMLGAPTVPEQQNNDEQNFQGLDRLVRAMQSGSRTPNYEGINTGKWQLTVISQPLERQQIRQQIDHAYALSSELAAQVRTSVQMSGNTSQQKSVSVGSSTAKGSNQGESYTRGKNTSGTSGKNQGAASGSNSSSSSSSTNTGTSQSKTEGTSESDSKSQGTSHTDTETDNSSLSDTKGSSLGITQEIANKRAQHLMDYLDKQLIVRLHQGLSKGLFHSAVYLTAEKNSDYQRLKNTVRATLQGAETTLSPLEVYDLPASARGQMLRLPTLISTAQRPEELLFHSLRPGPHNTLGSLLTADELATVASLPQQELQGIRRRKTVNFIVDLPTMAADHAIDLGTVVDHGRRYPNNRVRLQRKDLNKHVFVTGVTGSGKTTTCLSLLLESNLPFLVIEPAKTEYRALVTHLDSGIDYYRPNGDDHQSLRINPFALIRKSQRIKSHAGFLKNVFAAIFPMEASMPMMVEAAILASYEDKGWDIDDNEFLPGGDPFDPITRAWPTMSEMIRQLDRIIPTYGLGQEFTEKYRGSLVSRLRSLTDGTLGQVLDVPQSLCFHTLLERHAVIELEELQGGEEKALLMALLLGGINEAIRARHAENPDFRHLTLIEEAHRLLSRPEPGDKAAAMAVEAFADMLAEVRKYGAGLIIADQIPAKLIPDIIKNTHSKIVHRLFAEDDRRAMGEAMMMNDEQRAFLPNLATGEAVIFCGGWHGPAHAAIRNDRANTDSNPPALDISACGVQQLWRERARYYPQFCRLGWLSQEDAKNPQRADFAQFVRHTRQAQNQLLWFVSVPNRADSAFAFLKQWLARWQPLAQAQQVHYTQHTQQRSAWASAWPENLLAAAWMALLLDANPRPRPEAKNVASLFNQSTDHQPYLAGVCQTFLQLLADSADAKEWLQKLKALKATDPRQAKDLSEHLEHLAQIKKF